MDLAYGDIGNNKFQKKMNLIDFAQFGAAIVAIIALVIITKEFLKHSQNRDNNFTKFLERQEDNFTDIIKNHLHTDTEAKGKLEKSNLTLVEVLRQLMRFLERNGK